MAYQQKKKEKLTRTTLFSHLPSRFYLEGEAGGLPDKQECQLLLAKEPFLTLTGLALGDKPFVLPLGTKITVGFGWEESWGEFEAEVVGWSAGKEGYRVMLRCPLEGRLSQRRRYPRYPGRHPITAETQPGETENLSQSGLCVVFSSPLPEHRSLKFELLPVDADPIILEGRVVWQQPLSPTESFSAGVNLRPNEAWAARLAGRAGLIRPRVVAEEN